ncbi:hypothetical protein GDO86_011998 [Hymenochirus boettgeri]|uniref:Myb-like domain-containing protein n=1 Tax=Hymenochirus boettgeri TaxID=247094 RepID=A0A8T2JGG8_9PIPI|nr:hypothetical protein GDO86_011998 [Hymenochirus boettgeri]
MSEESAPHRRTSTRSARRSRRYSFSMPDSDTSSEETSTSSIKPLASPKIAPKVVLKEEPVDIETQAVSVNSDTQLSPSTSQVVIMQVRDSTGVAALGPSPFTGRKRKANFTNEETETLVKYVVKHFSALYGSEALRTESTRRNQRRSQLWNQIQKHVNDLGYTPRTIDDLKHKWRDLRLDVKRKITHRKASSKVPPAPGVTPILDTKLTPLEDLVASTIGHHCTLDGEQEGMYMEPGVPRQSIFFTCRGPTNSISESSTEKLSTTASPRPSAEIALMTPLVSSSPAQVAFIPVLEEGSREEQETDATQKVTIKPITESWATVNEICTLITNPNQLVSQPDLLLKQQKVTSSQLEILTVKQELSTGQNDSESGQCDSQGSVMSSPEDSLGNINGQLEWNVNGSGDGAVTAVTVESDTLQLKIEEEGDPEMEMDSGSQGNQDEWERQSVSPHHSENAQDSIPSSSQEGEPSNAGEINPNGEDCCLSEDGKEAWRTKMHRLLELEEQWDRLYHKELGMWEEERIRQQQQRAQDREIQQQLLDVLTDIRDELRQIRQEKAAARQAESPPATNGNAMVLSAPGQAVSPDKPSTVLHQKPTATPLKRTAAMANTQSEPPRRRGRPRINRPNTELNS